MVTLYVEKVKIYNDISTYPIPVPHSDVQPLTLPCITYPIKNNRPLTPDAVATTPLTLYVMNPLHYPSPLIPALAYPIPAPHTVTLYVGNPATPVSPQSSTYLPYTYRVEFSPQGAAGTFFHLPYTKKTSAKPAYPTPVSRQGLPPPPNPLFRQRHNRPSVPTLYLRFVVFIRRGASQLPLWVSPHYTSAKTPSPPFAAGGRGKTIWPTASISWIPLTVPGGRFQGHETARGRREI